MIKAVVKFFGAQTDAYGMPTPYFSYLVVSSPWDKLDSGIASIVPLSGSSNPVASSANPISPHHLALSGGEEAAYKKAVAALKSASSHTGLTFHEHIG
jgi:hypothetical protein